MLKNQKSLLTYQELHIVDTALIKWICIDLDIVKSEIDTNNVNEENLKSVKKTTDAIGDYLDLKEIPHLIEFSGRRGFHIWIVFDRLVTKEDGYNLVNYIYSNVKDSFDKIIVADKFPKTSYVNRNSKGVGYGIKLPLSQNKVSGKLSFFINRSDYFEFDQNKWLNSPNLDFLNRQLEILSGLKLVKYEQVESYIKEYSSSRVNILTDNFLKNNGLIKTRETGLSKDVDKIIDGVVKGCGFGRNMLGTQT